MRAQILARIISAAIFGSLPLSMPVANAGPIDTMEPGSWYEVPNSKLSNVDPCPARNCSYTANEGQSAVIDDWTGAAVATNYGTKGGYIVWGGGHSGYFGSEVYIFDVGTLQWKRVSEPVNNGICNYAEAELQDGSPCSSHTYDGVEYHPASNSFVILGAAGSHEGITSSPRVHLFSFATSTWRRGASYTGGGTPFGGATAYDASRDVFWIQPGFSLPFGKYDPNANNGGGGWTLYKAYNMDTGSVGAIDATRDIFVVIDGLAQHQIVVFDLKNPNSPVKVAVAGDTSPQQQVGSAFDWDPVQKVFVAWMGGTSVYILTPPSGDWRTGTWMWTKAPPSSTNAVTPTAPNMNHSYSHWRYIPAVNAWMVANRNTDNVFFYKLSPGSLIRPNSPLSLKAQ